MNIQWIESSKGEIIAAQVKNHHIDRLQGESLDTFKQRIELFAFNLARLMDAKQLGGGL